jgi:Protein of unknown function (DUF1257)
MSQYGSFQTQYRDKECLIQALNDQGYSTVEVHEQAQQLFDYTGRATHYLDASGDKAEVIVRRQYVGGAANDLGFKKQADGTYSAIISRYDTGKHDTKWLNQLKGKYTERVTSKEAKRIGAKFHSRTVVNGKTVIRYLQA